VIGRGEADEAFLGQEQTELAFSEVLRFLCEQWWTADKFWRGRCLQFSWVPLFSA
jgi:hypothetical protein